MSDNYNSEEEDNCIKPGKKCLRDFKQISVSSDSNSGKFERGSSDLNEESNLPNMEDDNEIFADYK